MMGYMNGTETAPSPPHQVNGERDGFASLACLRERYRSYERRISELEAALQRANEWMACAVTFDLPDKLRIEETGPRIRGQLTPEKTWVVLRPLRGSGTFRGCEYWDADVGDWTYIGKGQLATEFTTLEKAFAAAEQAARKGNGDGSA